MNSCYYFSVIKLGLFLGENYVTLISSEKKTKQKGIRIMKFSEYQTTREI